MERKTSQSGFTLLESLLSLSILLLTLPFLPFLFQSISDDSYYNELAIEQFFLFIADESHRAEYTVVDNNQIMFIHSEEKHVEISKYKSVIRRQIAGQGHEILVRDINSFIVTSSSAGIKIRIRDGKGDYYEKIIPIL
ncbi:competence type IV pilus minor pilin ComGF [Radiobacillus deserti]|nr:competence type IV pilus minor pilin ComGF [Radiobacillus deserti]